MNGLMPLLSRINLVCCSLYVLSIFVPSIWVCVLLYYGGSGLVYSEGKALSSEEQQNKSQIEILKISGESYGNSGGRFRSFIECSSDEQGLTKYFSGGSHLIMSATVLDNHQSAEGTATGFWQLDFHANGESSSTLKNGTFYSGQVSDEEGSGTRAFTLRGVETTDTVCGGAPRQVTIRAICTDTTPVYYIELDGDKVGSTTPPIGHDIYYLFSHKMKCL